MRLARMLISGVLLVVFGLMLVSLSAAHYAAYLVVAAVHLWIIEPAEIWLAAMIGRAWNFGKGDDAKDGDEKRQAGETSDEPSGAAEK